MDYFEGLRICQQCTFDESVIEFDTIPDGIGIDLNTYESKVVIPKHLRRLLYCTNCDAVYDKSGSFSRELTDQYRVLLEQNS